MTTVRNMIEIDRLRFAYAAKEVLKGVSFSAAAGELLAVLGPNGVGKTTLFRCMLGLQRGYEGTICFDGIDAKSLSPRALAHRIAYIPQTRGPAFCYSAFDMVLMGTTHEISALQVPGRRETETAEGALERLGILALRDKGFGQLSGGEQQLVLIARALAQNSRILLMDEPTASLDYGNQALVLRQVRALADEGYTVLLSTHNPQHALWYADRALALLDGAVEAQGRPADVIDAPLIRRLYGVEVSLESAGHGPLIAPVFDSAAQ